MIFFAGVVYPFDTTPHKKNQKLDSKEPQNRQKLSYARGLISPEEANERAMTAVYRNNLKNRDFGKKAPQNSHAERVTIAERQGTSEYVNFEEKPTLPKTDPSGCFGIRRVLPVSAEQIHEAQPLHGSSSASLLTFTNLG